jgi:hypothetical protein
MDPLLLDLLRALKGLGASLLALEGKAEDDDWLDGIWSGLDAIEMQVKLLENSLIYGADSRSRDWDMLQHARTAIEGWLDELAATRHGLARRPLDDARREQADGMIERAQALTERCREAAGEITRLLGEVGRWYDDRVLERG